ncbi:DNA-binding protein [Fulvitalea axinellae]|uniref:Viral histone-like protein n=1 Tax=Fulvitalea axinellae TaxID=1182444 RepID=A0AAU9CTD1_9BACT|nr:DNA-binding protein [Fulvitalea axinellae]
MPVEFKSVERRNPQQNDAPPKYYAQIVQKERVKIKEMAADIADISTVSEVDIAAVLSALVKMVPKYLAKGRPVKLGDLGTFSLSLKAEGVDTEDKVTAHTISGNKVNFRAGQEVRNQLKLATYAKAKSEKEEEETV